MTPKEVYAALIAKHPGSPTNLQKTLLSNYGWKIGLDILYKWRDGITHGFTERSRLHLSKIFNCRPSTFPVASRTKQETKEVERTLAMQFLGCTRNPNGIGRYR